MAPTPNMVHSVVVHNYHTQPMHVTVVYDDHKSQTEVMDTRELAPNTTHTFESKILEMGGWQAVAPVKRVTAGAAASNHTATLHPKVQGIVKALHVHVRGEAALEQGQAA